MSHTCPRCARLNPPAAQFCYHDGHVLAAGARQAVDPAKQRFPMPFVFPSGQACHSYDELVLAVAAPGGRLESFRFRWMDWYDRRPGKHEVFMPH